VPDSLSTLSDDESDLVSGDHHLKETRTSTAAASTTVVLLVRAGRAAMGAVALVGDDVINRGLGARDGGGLASEGALPLGVSSIVLGHLNFAAGIGLKPGDLFAAAADDQSDHFAGNGDGFGGQAFGHVVNASLHHFWSCAWSKLVYKSFVLGTFVAVFEIKWAFVAGNGSFLTSHFRIELFSYQFYVFFVDWIFSCGKGFAHTASLSKILNAS